MPRGRHKHSDEQKELADNYAYNLYVFLNDTYNEQSNSVHDSLADLGAVYPYDWTEGEFHSPFSGMEWTSRVTSGYGSRLDSFTGETDFHTGIDIAFLKGTEIRAAKSGVVTVSAM